MLKTAVFVPLSSFISHKRMDSNDSLDALLNPSKKNRKILVPVYIVAVSLNFILAVATSAAANYAEVRGTMR